MREGPKSTCTPQRDVTLYEALRCTYTTLDVVLCEGSRERTVILSKPSHVTSFFCVGAEAARGARVRRHCYGLQDAGFGYSAKGIGLGLGLGLG